jgi:subtilisin family serine protease
VSPGPPVGPNDGLANEACVSPGASRDRLPRPCFLRSLPVTTLTPLELVGLTALLQRGRGREDVRIGLIDGPLALEHPGLAAGRVRELPARLPGRCVQTDSPACAHGTLVAGVLVGERGSGAPAICPGCTLLVRPIFPEAVAAGGTGLSAAPADLAEAVTACVAAGARVINLSVALAGAAGRGERALAQALDQALRRGVLVVAAAGNQGTLGSSALTRHPGVVPVVACDLRGRPLAQSNLGGSLGRRGLCAPGADVASLAAGGGLRTFGGTSAAAPFVTGAVALLCSAFPDAPAAAVRWAVTRAGGQRRGTVVPPLLNAEAAYQTLTQAMRKGGRREPSGV